MWWLVIGGLGVLAVVTMALGLAKAAADGDRYLPRHAPGAGEGRDEPPPVYGSMILAEERAIEPFRWLPAAPDWREQTAADLAPEALAIPGAQDRAWREMVELGDELQGEDPGPGGLPSPGSVTPGPDPASPGPGEASRLADTGDIRDARLLAQVAEFMRAQDDETALYLAGLGAECARVRLDLTAALA